MQVSPTNEPLDPDARSWVRKFSKFSVRRLLIVVTLICLVLSWWFVRVRNQKHAVAWIERNGGVVVYDYQYDEDQLWDNNDPPIPEWLVNAFGRDCFFDVWAVHLMSFNHGKPVANHIGPLRHFPALRALSIDGNEVEDLSPVSGFRNLESVTLARTEVKDLLPLSKSVQIKTLDLSGSKNIADLSPLSSLKNLRHLSIAETAVNDLSPLSGLTELTYLDCYKATNIEDCECLQTLTNLENLDLSWTKVRERDWRQLRDILPKLD